MPITYIPSGCYTDSNGYKRLMWDSGDDTGIHNHKWLYDFPDEEDEAKITEWKIEQEFGWIERAKLEIESHDDLLKEFVIYVRNHPAMTLTQFNNYCNGKLWWENAVIKYFVYKLAVVLAVKYDVVLADYTAGQVWIKTRNWLCNSNVHLVSKVCFGVLNI